MALVDYLKETITQKPANLTKPHFYKAGSDAKRQLEQLQEIHRNASSSIKARIEQDIKMLQYGIAGEEQVAFELNNSYLPIIVLHDLHIEFDGLSAQIDYLIITNKVSLIVECKNLYGDIEVNSNGDFIRKMEYNRRRKKEGIYSPITQNKRHIEMIKKVRLTSKTNIITKALFEKYFDDNYKTVVVLANPKTVIDMRYAKKEVKEQIIRCDQLIEHIKKLMKESKNAVLSEKEMYELADFFLSLHTDNTVDYTTKYQIEKPGTEESVPPDISITSVEETLLYKELKQFRYDISKADGIKPYLVYTNSQLAGLISVMPKNLDEMKKVPGFGDVKCQKYGKEILDIINKRR